jgi:hypothetical protein
MDIAADPLNKTLKKTLMEILSELLTELLSEILTELLSELSSLSLTTVFLAKSVLINAKGIGEGW